MYIGHRGKDQAKALSALFSLRDHDRFERECVSQCKWGRLTRYEMVTTKGGKFAQNKSLSEKAKKVKTAATEHWR